MPWIKSGLVALKWVTDSVPEHHATYIKSTAPLMQALFSMWTLTQHKSDEPKMITSIFWQMTTSGKIQAQKVGCTWKKKDAGKGVFAFNRRSRSWRVIHQLMPEHFKTTTHDLQGRVQKRNRNTHVLRQSWQDSVCSTKCQRTRAATQRTSPRGLNKRVCSELFALQLFPDSFFLTLNFHIFSRNSKTRFLEKPQCN